MWIVTRCAPAVSLMRQLLLFASVHARVACGLEQSSPAGFLYCACVVLTRITRPAHLRYS